MADTLRDLVEWYPFLPWDTYVNTSIPAVVHAVLDARIIITLDAMDETWQLSEKGGVMFGDVCLMSITEESALVRIYDIFNHPENRNYIDKVVNVYVGQYAHPNPYSSYIVVDKSINWTGKLVFHPDCVLFLQKSPWLWFTDQPISQEITKSMFDWYGVFPAYNTDCMLDNNSVTFIAASGLGDGLCPVLPERECEGPLHAPVGLRSINGFSGNVVISDVPPVSLTVTAEIGSNSLPAIRPYPRCPALPTETNPDNFKNKDLRLTITPLLGGAEEQEEPEDPAQDDAQ